MNEKKFDRITEYAKKEIKKISKKEISYDFDSKIYKQGIIEDLNEIEKLKIDKNKVLDFGCGRGIFTLLLSNLFKESYGIDVKPKTDEKDIDPSGPLYKTQEKIWKKFENQFNTEFGYYDKRIPFENNKFDCVVAYAVLEHIAKKELINRIREINRVLKKNGIFYVSRTPRSWSFSERFGKYLSFGCHEKLFGEKEIKELLKRGGFEILRFERTDFIPGFLIFKEISGNQDCFKILWVLEKIILKTPLKYFAHHYKIIARKI
jgi:ubiquinone/menaquinone biosynthesis C-methylase UbiE